jgi:tryptophan-rich sensory protein
MSVNELNLTVNPANSININRVLGVIGMLFAPALYIGWFFHSDNFDDPKANQLFSSIFGVLYLTGAIASAIAMRRLRATGSGIGAAILFCVQVIGLFLAMWFDILEYAAPNLRESTIFFITDIAYPFSHVLMIIVGFAVWKTGVWNGWRLIPPFLCGFALPLFMASSALFGRENSGWIFIGGVTLGFLLLGYAVKNTK